MSKLCCIVYKIWSPAPQWPKGEFEGQAYTAQNHKAVASRRNIIEYPKCNMLYSFFTPFLLTYNLFLSKALELTKMNYCATVE